MTAVGWARPEHPIAGALTKTHAAIDDVTESTVWSLPDAELAELTRDCHRLESRFAELSLRLVAEADRRQTAERSGATSTQTWLRRELNLTPAAAKQQVTVAAELAGPLELTREALAAGDLSRAHVEAIVRVMDALPSSIGSKPRADAERQLIAWCREFDPREVARLRRRLWEVIDPDGADAREAALLERQEREAKQKRSLAFGTDGSVGTCFEGCSIPSRPRPSRRRSIPWPSRCRPPQTAQTGARRVSATPTRWSSCVGDSSRPTTCPPGVGRSRRSSSPWSWTSCVRVSDRVCWTPVTACHPTPCASWPATHRSSPRSSAPTGSRWISDVPPAPSPRLSGEHSAYATAKAVPSRVATAR